MEHQTALCVMGIIASVLIMGYGIRICLSVFIEMMWLLTRVVHKPDASSISYKFSTVMMILASVCFPAGLALLLVSVKYLP
jgi:hypothetical protein